MSIWGKSSIIAGLVLLVLTTFESDFTDSRLL